MYAHSWYPNSSIFIIASPLLPLVPYSLVRSTAWYPGMSSRARWMDSRMRLLRMAQPEEPGTAGEEGVSVDGFFNVFFFLIIFYILQPYAL